MIINPKPVNVPGLTMLPSPQAAADEIVQVCLWPITTKAGAGPAPIHLEKV